MRPLPSLPLALGRWICRRKLRPAPRHRAAWRGGPGFALSTLTSEFVALTQSGDALSRRGLVCGAGALPQATRLAEGVVGGAGLSSVALAEGARTLVEIAGARPG